MENTHRWDSSYMTNLGGCIIEFLIWSFNCCSEGRIKSNVQKYKIFHTFRRIKKQRVQFNSSFQQPLQVSILLATSDLIHIGIRKHGGLKYSISYMRSNYLNWENESYHLLLIFIIIWTCIQYHWPQEVVPVIYPQHGQVQIGAIPTQEENATNVRN
jgi:hypothetical protein